MANIKSLDHTFLSECFMYDHETGHLYCKERPISHFATLNAWSVFKSKFGGKKAGALQHDGYLVVQVCKRSMLVHRVCFAIYNDGIPDDMYIDHINGIKTDNRISNIRIATSSQNSANTLRNPCCVVFHKQSGKWQAQVKSVGNKAYIGLFGSRQEALEVASKRRKELFNEFAT